jgi:hypothetical protein
MSENTDMPRTVADRFAEAILAAGVRPVYGIVGDNLNGLDDAIRAPGQYRRPLRRRRPGQVDLVVGNAGIPNVASLTVWHKVHRAAGRAAAMLALAAGLLGAIGARAGDAPTRLQHAAERAGPGCVRAQPANQQFAPPKQPDVSAADARCVDALYRLLMGPQPAHASDPRSSTGPWGIVE